jgi:hypothetical protein
MTRQRSGKEAKHKGRQQFDYTEWYREAEGMRLGLKARRKRSLNCSNGVDEV